MSLCMYAAEVKREEDISLYLMASDTPLHPYPSKQSREFLTHPNITILKEEMAVKTRPGMQCAVQVIILPKKEGYILHQVSDDSQWDMQVPVLSGYDRFGRAFSQTIEFRKDIATPLWILFKVPHCYRGIKEIRLTLTLRLMGAEEKIEIPIKLLAEGNTVFRGGEDSNKSMERLFWLNKTTGIKPDSVTAPYPGIAPDFTGTQRSFTILGREITIGNTGLPSSLKTKFSGINDVIEPVGEDILQEELRLSAYRQGVLVSMNMSLRMVKETLTKVTWESSGESEMLSVTIKGTLHFDGWMQIRTEWQAKEDISLDDIVLSYQPKHKYARWFSGLGTMAVEMPEHWHWQWDESKQQDGFYLGGMNGGVILRPLDSHYVRPFCNIYHQFGSKNMPASWVNDGKGYFEAVKQEEGVLLTYHTGSIAIKQGETIETSFDLGFTPFKQTDVKTHYETKYYHRMSVRNPEHPEEIIDAVTNPDEFLQAVKNLGATHVNIHHANALIPFINYPMYHAEKMADFIDKAHRIGLKVKPYYSIREITSNMPEFYALCSLGDEIFPAAHFEYECVTWQDGKDPYLEEECGQEVVPAWKATIESGAFEGRYDASVVTNPDSRLMNFYMEGLRFMCDNLNIDGIYIDDTGLDRDDIQRVRKILDSLRPGAKIDLHSWNHFEGTYGAGWANNIVMYAELMPYLDSLWLGESFDYNQLSPLEILVETSGLNFGLMSEMLEGDGNVWRGMLTGATNRAGYMGISPKGIWQLRETYGLDEAKLIGWWDEDSYMQASEKSVYVTVYETKQGILVCAANFSAGEVTTVFTSSSEAAFEPEVVLPYIEAVQEEKKAAFDHEFTIAAKGGVIFFASFILL